MIRSVLLAALALAAAPMCLAQKSTGSSAIAVGSNSICRFVASVTAAVDKDDSLLRTDPVARVWTQDELHNFVQMACDAFFHADLFTALCEVKDICAVFQVSN